MLTKNEREKMVSAQLEAAVWEPVAGHRHPRAELPLVEGGHLQHPQHSHSSTLQPRRGYLRPGPGRAPQDVHRLVPVVSPARGSQVGPDQADSGAPLALLQCRLDNRPTLPLHA